MMIQEQLIISEKDIKPIVQEYIYKASEKHCINMDKSNFTEEDIDVFAQAIFSLAKEQFGIEDERLSKEISDLIPLSRAYPDSIEFISSAVAFYYSYRDFPDEKTLRKNEIYPYNIRGKSYTPITLTDKKVEELAELMADIIDLYDRSPIIFANILETYRATIQDPFYSPKCLESFLHVDSGTNSRQNGTMTRKQMANVIDTKITCNNCPLQTMCLASSLAVPQTTRMSQKETVIPTKYGDNLTMVDFLMFGGYTPQERRAIFERTVVILSQRDKEKNE